jgi:Ca2+/H+ antiporter, TMEM165/GDT1 family
MAEHWSGVTAAFLASFVEFVEALTIVLAVAAVRGWRPALLGTATAAAILAALVLAFGPRLAELNVPAFHLVVGFLLLLFGLRWLKKSVLRAAGVLKLHDEALAYEKETEALRTLVASRPSPTPLLGKERQTEEARADAAGMLTAFNGVFVEGTEVVFIVLAVGAAGRSLWPPAIGAAAAALAVIGLGVIVRGPLTRIPENVLKFAVGALISAFGTFWVGEGIGLSWPWSDYMLILLALGYAAVAAGAVALCRGPQLVKNQRDAPD